MASRGVDDEVKANKRKLRDLELDEKVTKKKQKNGIVDKSKYKDVEQGKKARPRKGISKFVPKFAFCISFPRKNNFPILHVSSSKSEIPIIKPLNVRSKYFSDLLNTAEL
ncbi:hypothetical protein QTP88_017564 [Uroleucon formosanum]